MTNKNAAPERGVGIEKRYDLGGGAWLEKTGDWWLHWPIGNGSFVARCLHLASDDWAEAFAAAMQPVPSASDEAITTFAQQLHHEVVFFRGTNIAPRFEQLVKNFVSSYAPSQIRLPDMEVSGGKERELTSTTAEEVARSVSQATHMTQEIVREGSPIIQSALDAHGVKCARLALEAAASVCNQEALDTADYEDASDHWLQGSSHASLVCRDAIRALDPAAIVKGK